MEQKLMEKFDKEIGAAFIFEDEKFPEYLLCFDNSHHLSLYNMSKYPRELKFKKFSLGELPKSGYIMRGRLGYNIEYINAINNILNPNEYCFETLENKEFDKINDLLKQHGMDKIEIHKFQEVLHLKKGSYAVVIAPRIFDEEIDKQTVAEGFSVYEFDKIFKKASSSVMVW